MNVNFNKLVARNGYKKPNIDYTNEIWKSIKGYEGIYEISNKGRIKTFHNNDKIFLKPKVNYKGYEYISLCKNGIMKWYFIHTLVANTFVNNPNNYLIINHIDKNPSNNCADNLEWCNHSYNAKYSIDEIKKAHRHEKISIIRINNVTGEKVYYSGIREAARLNNTYHSNILKAIKNDSYCVGYKWKYNCLTNAYSKL